MNKKKLHKEKSSIQKKGCKKCLKEERVLDITNALCLVCLEGEGKKTEVGIHTCSVNRRSSGKKENRWVNLRPCMHWICPYHGMVPAVINRDCFESPLDFLIQKRKSLKSEISKFLKIWESLRCLQ